MDTGGFKQRAIGILVLVALAAIIIPWVMDLRRGGEFFGGGIPDKPDKGFVTRVLPLNNWRDQAQADLNAGMAQVAASAAEPASQDVPTPAADAPVSPPAASRVESIAKPSKPAGEPVAWVVQLGSFTSEKNALELRDRLRAKGYSAFTETVPYKDGTLIRVRVGPELLRSRADTLRDELQRDMKLQAIVQRYP